MSGQTKLGSKLVVFFLVEARNGLVASATLVLLLHVKRVLSNHRKCMHSAPRTFFSRFFCICELVSAWICWNLGGEVSWLG